MKAVCFYHDADTDGHCSGAIVRYFIKKRGFLKEQGIEDVECIGINYGYDKKLVFDVADKDTYVFLTDFTLDSEDMLELEKRVHKVIWIDHHISRIKENSELEHLAGLRDPDVAATLLAWVWFNKERMETNPEEVVLNAEGEIIVPPAIRMISDYDTWNHDDAGQVVTFEKGISIINTVPSNDESLDFWENVFTVGVVADMNDPEEVKKRFQWDAVMQIMNLGGVCMTYKNNRDEQWMTKTFRSVLSTPLGDFECDVFNGHLEDSYAFDYSKHTDLDIKCWYYYNGKGYKYSLRSKEADVAAIASSFGGGGHTNSAGFYSTQDLFDTRKTPQNKNKTN